MQPSAPPNAPKRRVIIVGASNVTLGVSSLIRTCHAAWGTPLEFFYVGGHGRALEYPSRVLGRVLPPTLECGIWKKLEERPKLPTAVLVTDIGNDLVYGAPPDQVVDSVAKLLARLKPQAERIVMTGLPADSIARIPRKHYYRFRRWLFPSSPLEYDDAITGARKINRRLLEIPTQYDCYLISPQLQWYGKDPVHVRWKWYPHAWARFVTPWLDFGRTLTPKLGKRVDTWRWWRRLRPAQEQWWKKNRLREQPCFRDAKGSTYWVY